MPSWIRGCGVAERIIANKSGRIYVYIASGVGPGVYISSASHIALLTDIIVFILNFWRRTGAHYCSISIMERISCLSAQGDY